MAAQPQLCALRAPAVFSPASASEPVRKRVRSQQSRDRRMKRFRDYNDPGTNERMLADYSAACQRAADAAAHRGARKAEKGAARGARHVKRDLIAARATAQRRLKATVRSQQTTVVQQKVRNAFRTGLDGAAHAPRGGGRAAHEQATASRASKRARLWGM